jgi:putative SOS response-associated peptidase YedK
VPSWSDDAGRSSINARSETVAISGAFRAAFKHRRLLVPASGFYEWKAPAGGKGGKMPHYIRLLNDKILCFAGIWESHQGQESFAILTTRPNALMTGLHDRMPVIVRPERFEAWLREGATDVLEPYSAEEMEAYAVSRRVNKASVDDAQLVEREGGLF